MARKLLENIRNQWMGALALFLVLTGGSAYALSGSNTVFTDDITDNQVYSSDVRDDTLPVRLLPVRDRREPGVDLPHRFVAEVEEVGVERRKVVVGPAGARHVRADGLPVRDGVVLVLDACRVTECEHLAADL